MKKNKVDTALILAAGFGKRMLPLTSNTPKSLIKIKNKPLLQYCIDSLEKSGIKNILINVHYESEQITSYIKQLNRNFLISDETKKLLDTGGAIKKAFKLIKAKNMLVMNSDVMWNSHSVKSIQSLVDNFDFKKMDSLLLTTKIENTSGYSGAGDFIKNKNNQLQRFSKNTLNKPLVFCGLQIVNRRQFDVHRGNVFSTNKIWDQNIKQKKLYTFVTNKKFNHVGTKESVVELNK